MVVESALKTALAIEVMRNPSAGGQVIYGGFQYRLSLVPFLSEPGEPLKTQRHRVIIYGFSQWSDV